MRSAAVIGGASALIAALVAAPALLAAAAPAPDEPPPGPGLDLIKQKCVNCHPISMITTKRKTPEEWGQTIETMAGRGADVTPEEMETIAEYLSKTYPATDASPDAARKNP